MNFLVSNTQGLIISVLLIPVFLLVGFLFFKVIKNSNKKINESKMLSLNLVITYSNFIKYLTYKDSIKEDYAIFMISINNFTDLAKKNNEKISKAYIRKTVKNLSMMLPYGGKLAQTKKRDTFVLYVPNIYGNEIEFANMIKESSFDPLMVNGKPIFENLSIGYTTASNKQINVLIDEANQAMVSSKRNLNTITKYSTSLNVAKEDYMYVSDKINRDEYRFNIYDLIRERNQRNESFVITTVINRLPFENYLLQIAQSDRQWVNLNIVTKLLNVIEKYYQEKPIYLPFLISTIESRGFIEYLETLIAVRGLEPKKVVLLLYPDTVYKQEIVTENLLRLKEKGFVFAYHLEQENPHYVLFSEKYYIDKILIDFDNNRYEAEFLDNLSSFCLGNQIETIVKGDIRNMPNFTCYLKELDTIKLNEKEVKVKKMKAKKGK